MLDSDVARLYKYETKNVNKAMKRNLDRFPEDFCFQLTEEELKQMWFHFGTTSEKENIKYRSEKYLPYVYTEQGISMLSGLLKNEVAVQVSINIMRAFVEMRKFILNNAQGDEMYIEYYHIWTIEGLKHVINWIREYGKINKWAIGNE